MADDCCMCGEVIPVTDLYMTTPKGEYVCESCYSVDLPGKDVEAHVAALEARALMQKGYSVDLPGKDVEAHVAALEARALMQKVGNAFEGEPLPLVAVTLGFLFRETLRQMANGDKRLLTNLVDQWATEVKLEIKLSLEKCFECNAEVDISDVSFYDKEHLAATGEYRYSCLDCVKKAQAKEAEAKGKLIYIGEF